MQLTKASSLMVVSYLDFPYPKEKKSYHEKNRLHKPRKFQGILRITTGKFLDLLQT